MLPYRRQPAMLPPPTGRPWRLQWHLCVRCHHQSKVPLTFASAKLGHIHGNSGTPEGERYSIKQHETWSVVDDNWCLLAEAEVRWLRFRFDFDFSSIRNPETVTHRLQQASQTLKTRPCHNEDKPQSITLHHEVFNEATSCSGAIWLSYRSFDTASVGVSGKPSNFTRLHIFCRSTTFVTSAPVVSVPDTTAAAVL